MTSDTRSPDEIERDIAAERARLAGSINQLQEKFSMETIIRDVGDGLRDQSGEFARAFSRTVSRNPTAAVVAGAGLAWLLLGKGSSRAQASDERHSAKDSYQPRRDFRSEPQDITGRMSRDWGADREQNSGQSTAQTMKASVASGAQKLGEGLTAARERLGDTADSVSEGMSSLSERLSKGTEQLSDEARARVVAARQAAWDAQERARNMTSKGTAAATGFFDDQPLVVGALAVAVGAALGGLVPRTRFEDNAMGASSDSLYEEAERIFREEKEKLSKVVSAATSEAANIAHEAADSISDRAEGVKDAAKASTSYVGDAAARVTRTAQEEARKQKLGEL